MSERLTASTPFFMTHHAPVGAWSSLTFGLPGKGVSIDHETPNVDESADLIVAISRGPGKTEVLPFASGASVLDNETLQTTQYIANFNPTSMAWKDRWRFFQPAEIQRRLTAGVDEFTAGDLSFKVYTPHPSLPDPETGASLAYEVCPGLLLELSIDNRSSAEPAYGFLGLANKGRGRIRPFDWSGDGSLSGIALSGQWGLAANSIDQEVFTVRDNVIAPYVEQGRKEVHNGGQEGGVLIIVPPGEQKRLTAAFGFYHAGEATQGIHGTYLFHRYFKDLESVCSFILHEADRIRSDAQALDQTVRSYCQDPQKYELFCQSVRAYYASTQLTEGNGKVYYTVLEGQYFWRNTMDLAVDHLPFELWRNPWVVRNIMDLYIDDYSYRDQIRFKDEPGSAYPGGLSFAHDMGSHSAYSPKGTSGYEKIHSRNYGYMTTEELLNGIYCLASYALVTKDNAWAKLRTETAIDLLASMENRDHPDPSKRNGLIKGETTLCGTGHEITTYDCLDPSLLSAVGNLYIAVKTFAAAHMLANFFRFVDQPEAAKRAELMAGRTAAALPGFFDTNEKFLHANYFQTTDSKIIAAIEPLAVPLFFGLGPLMEPGDPLFDLFLSHIRTCLKKGVCIDAKTGDLRLSSASTNTWPSKTVLCVYVIETLFGIPLNADYPSVMEGLCHWTQVSAAERSISDQIDSADRRVIGAMYYPRIVTSAVWVTLGQHS